MNDKSIFNFESYDYDTSKDSFIEYLYKQRPMENIKIDSRNTDDLKNIIIEELDGSDKVVLTGKQIRSSTYDTKKGVFVIYGDILEDDNNTLKLNHMALTSKENQFIRDITIIHSNLIDDTVYCNLHYIFKGYIINYYEYFDTKGNMKFELVLGSRKELYNDKIFVRRRLDFLYIAEVQEVGEISLPVSKKQLERSRLNVGDTFWACSGVILATVTLAGTLGAAASAPVLVTITAIYAGNTLWSNARSIYLDWNERDDEINLDTWLNNPLKMSFRSFGNTAGLFFNFDTSYGESLGESAYYLSEIAIGFIGNFQFAKGFKFNDYYKYGIKNVNSTLGKLKIKVLKLKYGKIGFDIHSLNDGQKGIISNYQSWQQSSKSLEEGSIKPTFKPITTLEMGE
ncbi:hypothetical protein [Cetobacterium sp.]|uniref:hypothetical protein n=1 Tax=Cetobacterium sp. TaxID=2071632 RepID=UPI003F3F4052